MTHLSDTCHKAGTCSNHYTELTKNLITDSSTVKYNKIKIQSKGMHCNVKVF